LLIKQHACAQRTIIMTKLTVLAAFLAFAAITNPAAAEGQRSFSSASYAHLMRSAEEGNVAAQAQLGWMFLGGRGVPQNFFKAAKWYYLAAVQGHREAQFQLGLLYNKGQGVARDYVLSYMWLNLSASQAVGDDRDYKVRMRDSVATKMTVAEIALAQQMALTWFKTR
jgi:uncharacterized protein